MGRSVSKGPFIDPHLAEKVETREEFERAQRLGFSHFQGYYFSRPELC